MLINVDLNILKVKYVIIILFSVFCLSCHNQQLTERLDFAESFIEDHPDSSLAIVKSIDTLSLKSKAIKARYALLYAMALDKNYVDTTNINVVLPAVNYYSKHGSSDERFKSYYYLGRIQYNAGNYSAAAISFSNAEDIGAEMSDVRAKGLLYMAFADIYNKTRNKEKEEEYVKKGASAFEEAGDAKYVNLLAGRLAIVYYGKQEWEKADSLFKVGIEKAREDTFAMSIFLSNYARLKVVQPDKDPEGAIKLLNDLNIVYKHPLSLTDYGVWAYASALIGDNETCAKIENQLNKLDDSRKKTILYWLYQIELQRGNYQKALEYHIVSNARNSDRIDQLLSDSIGQSLKGYYSSEATRAKQETHIIRLRLLLLILGLCLLFLIALAYLKFKRDRKEKEIDRLLKIGEETTKLLMQTNADLQRQNSEMEGEHQNLLKILEDLRREYVSTYKDKFSAVGELCEAYMSSTNRDDKNDFIVRRVESLIAYISDNDKLHARFEGQINKDLNDIVKHLKADLGGVSKKDSRFICYCIVGFEPEMIGSILGLSISNVYTKKSRLKEKIRELDSPYKEEYLRML